MESSRASREGSLDLLFMNRALFLDRDGVINQDNGYTFKLSDLRILNGVIEGLQAIGRLKYKIIIITNQSGIARGLFKENEFHKFMKKLTEVLAENEILICDYFYCPHHIDGIIKEFSRLCKCRKPHPGMIFEARDKHDIDLSQSILIGDKVSDIKAGIAADIPNNIIISDSPMNQELPAVACAKDLVEAANIILSLK